MSQKNKIVVLSDIHIGTNTQTVWYQQKYHEPYLLAVLEWIIENKNEIKELVLLGDIVDFWTYPSDEKPPSFDEIIKANPKILGENGKLSDVLVELEGKVTYVRGNHDMNISQEDLDKIKNTPYPDYKITLHEGKDDIYYPLYPDKRIACTHGHFFTMFNAPYNGSDNQPSPIAPLPLGHFITRAIASWNKTRLEDKPNKTVADYEGSDEPSLGAKLHAAIEPFYDKLVLAYLCSENKEYKADAWETFTSLARSILAITADLGKIENDEIITLPNGNQIAFGEVNDIYENLFSEWRNKDDLLSAYKAIKADWNGDYLGCFAQKLAFEWGAELVVMGHTHTPVSGLSNSLIQYANTGFNCPSLVDLKEKKIVKHPTFIEINIDSLKVEMKKVVEKLEGEDKLTRKYAIVGCTKEEAKTDQVATNDFSCYVIIDNSQGNFELTLTESTCEHGHYIGNLPTTVQPKEKVRFWLQDYPMAPGAEGSVKCTYTDKSDKIQEVKLTYACPLTSSNVCKTEGEGLNFYTKSANDSDWGNQKEVKTSGHPFFVKFIMPTG